MEKLKLIDLNIDCLLYIFSYCSEKDLLNLCRANPILSRVIDYHFFYKRTLDMLMSGHRDEPRIEKKNRQPISYADRLIIGNNWVQGCYKEWEFFPHKKMFATKIWLEQNSLYLTYANYLRQYWRRGSSEPLQRKYLLEISKGASTDISDFVKKGATIFASRVCGNCFIYENGYLTEQRLHASKEYTTCVDFHRKMYVSSSERCGRLWRRADEMGLVHLDLVKQLKHGYKCFQFSADGYYLFGGVYTDVGRRALREIDMVTGFEKQLRSNTISVYDLKVKDPNVLLTAHFDTTFRMHDRRVDKDVGIWEDPFDSSYYCLEYDGLYGVLCGTKYYGRVNLFDIRVPNKYVQLYFPRGRIREDSSPVHSIACDSRYLFVSTDHNLHVYDFKTDSQTCKDYRNIFAECRRYTNYMC